MLFFGDKFALTAKIPPVPISATYMPNMLRLWIKFAATVVAIAAHVNEVKLKNAAVVPARCFGAVLMAPALAVGRMQPMPRVTTNMGIINVANCVGSSILLTKSISPPLIIRLKPSKMVLFMLYFCAYLGANIAVIIVDSEFTAII